VSILVLCAHPHLELSRVNRALLAAARGATLPHVTVRDLYALYPDYLIDVAAEQALLEKAELVVWQHPLHWYGMPALMKLWVDEVLSFGWAYGPEGHALRGKSLWLVTSTGGTEDAYRPGGHNRFFFDAFLAPYDQTAALCGLRFLPPLVLHGAHRADDAALDAHVSLYLEKLGSYPQWPEIEALTACEPLALAPDDRPESEPVGGFAYPAVQPQTAAAR
jgi:glutathione-regulated potassium-efflux system ancillary protein KefF